MNTKQLGMLALALAFASTAAVAQESKNMKVIGERLLTKASKGTTLLSICDVRKTLQEQSFPPNNDPNGSIRIYVYSRKGSATLDMSAKDEGFERLNVGLENLVRELGAELVEKE